MLRVNCYHGDRQQDYELGSVKASSWNHGHIQALEASDLLLIQTLRIYAFVSNFHLPSVLWICSATDHDFKPFNIYTFHHLLITHRKTYIITYKSTFSRNLTSSRLSEHKHRWDIRSRHRESIPAPMKRSSRFEAEPGLSATEIARCAKKEGKLNASVFLHVQY